METSVRLEGTWLEVGFREPHSVLSWAVMGGGWQISEQVLWHQVSNRDLPIDVDPVEYLRRRIDDEGKNPSAVVFLTSALLSAYRVVCEESGPHWVRCVATVGLSNAVRIGDPPCRLSPAASQKRRSYGTINLLVQTSLPLSLNSSLEAISLVAEARTTAMLEAGLLSTQSRQLATGTGTDCIAIASPRDGSREVYAGKHTEIGYLIGRAALTAAARGIEGWKARRI